MYNYARPAAFQQPFLPPFTPNYGMAVFGQDAPAPAPAPAPAATGTMWNKFTTALGQQNSIVPVKNGYLLGGAAALGLVIVGSYEGWFGKRRSRR